MNTPTAAQKINIALDDVISSFESSSACQFPSSWCFLASLFLSIPNFPLSVICCSSQLQHITGRKGIKFTEATMKNQSDKVVPLFAPKPCPEPEPLAA